MEEHKFLPQPKVGPGTSPALGCLTVQGTRVTRGGGLVAVSTQDCPVVFAVLPGVPGLAVPAVPSRRPLLALLTDASGGGAEIVGHYDPWATGLTPSAGTNLLVHFAQGSWTQSAEAIEQALAGGTRRDAALVVVDILATGGLARTTRTSLNGNVTVLLTDDPAANWSSVFQVGNAPATVLVGPEGNVRWADEGPPDPAKLSKVLDKQLEVGGEVSWQPMRSAVAASYPAPDAPLRLGEGRQLPVRRLRGAPAVLSFWASCSEPSVEQLRQLRETMASRQRDRPFVLGVGDGESPQQVEQVAERERLPFPLVPDPEREIARRYGISSWPTTVQIDPEGRVAAADLGLVPGLSPCDRPTTAGASSLA